ncbi:MAG: hypothetical protein FJX77_02235 [Armatimonadetes bacterium]|nr:hypothetical protein [Armatimonadota bacterium]
MKGRRGAATALVLALYLFLVALLGGAVTVAAASAAAAEREYRRSQALALAEAGVEEARWLLRPHDLVPLGSGRYAWAVRQEGESREIEARGEVQGASGARVTRSVRVRLGPGKPARILSWREEP